MSGKSENPTKIRRRIKKILKQKTMSEADIAYLGKQMALSTHLEDIISPEDSGYLLQLFNSKTCLKEPKKGKKK